jgi:hypothetical protein
MNTIRLRVWVNQMMIKPVDTAARKKLLWWLCVLKNVGMRIMIDFHYSDSWAILPNNLNQLLGKSFFWRIIKGCLQSHFWCFSALKKVELHQNGCKLEMRFQAVCYGRKV